MFLSDSITAAIAISPDGNLLGFPGPRYNDVEDITNYGKRYAKQAVGLMGGDGTRLFDSATHDQLSIKKRGLQDGEQVKSVDVLLVSFGPPAAFAFSVCSSCSMLSFVDLRFLEVA